MQNVLVSLALQAMERIQGLDELEVCEEVGRGAFGVVFRGIIKATGQEVAIKQIDLENELADLFEVNKEIQILSECRIPQITRYMGCFVKGYKLWVIMEYVNGGSLFEILRPGPITDEMTISVISHQILLALNYLHDQGKIHRDLKSQNILLSQEGEVKLTDFGVSTQLYSNFSRRNTTVGTPYWMAPEIILSNNGGHSYKADIWSLGCCIYELRTEKPPLQNELAPMAALRRISACRSDDDFLRMLNLDNMSDLLKDFLKRCFVVDPANRPSASKLLKHKFITQSTRLENDSKKVLLKRLITRKLVWAQENHQPKTQRFYVPTEIASNQQKWQDAEGSEGGKQKANTINFDFSTIQDVPVLNNPDVFLSTALHENDVSPTPSSGSMNYKNELPQTNKALKLEHIKLLNRVFAKLELKVSISTTQYDELVTLNQKLANLFSPVQYSENNQTRILICQYLKYYLRELTKHQSNAETSSLRLQLQRAIIPSNIQVNHTASLLTENFPRKNTPLNPLDEIENSLLESWLDKMGNY